MFVFSRSETNICSKSSCRKPFTTNLIQMTAFIEHTEWNEWSRYKVFTFWIARHLSSSTFFGNCKFDDKIFHHCLLYSYASFYFTESEFEVAVSVIVSALAVLDVFGEKKKRGDVRFCGFCILFHYFHLLRLDYHPHLAVVDHAVGVVTWAFHVALKSYLREARTLSESPCHLLHRLGYCSGAAGVYVYGLL